jgi:EmrB/QacA subfamily drug resistance transporter
VTAPAVRVPIERRAWLTLVITATAGFMVSLEITVISLALPEIRAAFPDADPTTLSWIFTAYNIGVASLLLLSGWLADKAGRKKIFLTGLAVFAIGSLGSGAAVGVGMLIICRVVQAVGGSMLYPSGLALLLPAFPIERRSFAVGVWGAMGALAAALGPTVGALLVEGFGWRAVFFVNLPVAAAGFVLGLRFLKESKGQVVHGRVDVLSVPLAAIGVGLLVLGITKGDDWGWASASTIGCFAGAVVLLVAFVMRSHRHPRPLFDLDLFRLRSYTIANVGTVLFTMAFFGWLTLMPSFIQALWGWSVLHTGFAIAPGPLLAGLVSGPIGGIADRVGFRPVLILGGATGAAGLAWLAVFTDATPDYVKEMLIPGLLLGISAGCCFAMLVGAAMRDVPPPRFAMAGAGRTTVFQLAIALGIAVAAAIVGAATPTPDAVVDAYRASWWVGAACMGAMAVLFAVAYPAHRSVAVSVAASGHA